ncbi:hypothetical protein PVAND_016230 [Polypedilum vanderplanki]|uniref:Uncharacterized protein n=1 Tax=Polypedilum vanderplanki TaxID=319348 RepID=A0A9J6BFM1_POLVA|nr:hypothetical protein PVAND_016230 [Polypedilum vanderplanki]
MAQIDSVKNKHVIEWLILWLLFPLSQCSEFPDRECCDPVFPFDITDPEPLPPLPTTTITSSLSNGQNSAGSNSLQQHGAQALPGRSGYFYCNNLSNTYKH